MRSYINVIPTNSLQSYNRSRSSGSSGRCMMSMITSYRSNLRFRYCSQRQQVVTTTTAARTIVTNNNNPTNMGYGPTYVTSNRSLLSLNRSTVLMARNIRPIWFVNHTNFSTTRTMEQNNEPSSALPLSTHPYQYLQRITNSTRSLGVWEGIESLYNNKASPISSSSSIMPTSGSIVWDTIQQLPEIETVTNSLMTIGVGQQQQQNSITAQQQQYTNAINALERSIQIFGSYRPGGMEQIACFALLVELYNRNLQYDKCITTMQDLLSTYSNSNSTNETEGILISDLVQMAIAKVYWVQGKHEMAKDICDRYVDEERPVAVVARTGQAVSRLLLVTTLDDVFSVRDPFRMTIKRLERMVSPSSTVLAAAYLNVGIAEMVWAETVSKFNDVDAPLDAAMRNWKQGTTVLTNGDLTTGNIPTKMKHTNNNSPLRTILHARLLGNMAYGMLQMTYYADYITKAMEYASESLSLYDAMIHTTQNVADEQQQQQLPIDPTILLYEREGLHRTLSLLATCYHLNGNAITSQGLFQSALDKVPMHWSATTPQSTITMATSLQLLEQRDTHEQYANLCHDWEKRESDEKQQQQYANDIDTVLLPDGWKGKSSIHGSLWFWTASTMQRH